MYVMEDVHANMCLVHTLHPPSSKKQNQATAIVGHACICVYLIYIQSFMVNFIWENTVLPLVHIYISQ